MPSARLSLVFPDVPVSRALMVDVSEDAGIHATFSQSPQEIQLLESFSDHSIQDKSSLMRVSEAT